MWHTLSKTAKGNLVFLPPGQKSTARSFSFSFLIHPLYSQISFFKSILQFSNPSPFSNRPCSNPCLRSAPPISKHIYIRHRFHAATSAAVDPWDLLLKQVSSFRGGRAFKILVGRTEACKMTTTISSYSSCSNSYYRQFLLRNFADVPGNSASSIFTRQFSVRRRDPWDVSRKSTHFFKQLSDFVSDLSPTPLNISGCMPNGYASLTTSSGNDAKGKKLNKNGEERNVVTKGERVNNAKILSTLAKYLWMKDNMEFRFRVLTAMGFLVGAKVSRWLFLVGVGCGIARTGASASNGTSL